MSARVAINGLGRIGRAVLKVVTDDPALELVAVNDLVDAENLAYLLRFDTVYGRYAKPVAIEEGDLVIAGRRLRTLRSRDPGELPWKELAVDLVFECTGALTRREDLERHVRAGARSVLLSAPSRDGAVETIVHGVNVPEGTGPTMLSCASCTTNCITPVVEVIGRRIGFKKAVMTTVHAYTASQSIVDGPGKDFRRGRAAAANLVPATTGAALATTQALPEYAGLFDGIAIRAPIPVGSIADITFLTSRRTRPVPGGWRRSPWNSCAWGLSKVYRLTMAMVALRLLLAVVAMAPSGCSQPAPRSTPSPASAQQPTPAAAGGPRLYVTNERSGDLSVIDVGTRQVVATVPLGKRPRGVRVSPDGTALYVALSGSPFAPPGVDEKTLPPPDRSADGIGVVDVRALRLVRVIPVGTDPEQLAVSADGRRLFVANEDAATVSVVEVADGRRIATVPVGGEPEGVERSPDGATVYATSEEDSEVFAIDAADGRLIRKFAVPARPRSIAFLPDGTRAYVTCENGHSIAVVDARRHRPVTTIPLEGENARPMGVVSAPDGRRVYVTTGRGRMLVTIDTTTDRPIAAVEVGPRPWGIAISDDGRTLYTANGPSNDVSIVDVASGTVTGRVKVGESPWGVAIATPR